MLSWCKIVLQLTFLIIMMSNMVSGLWDIILNTDEEKCIKELNLKEDKIIYLYFRHYTDENNSQLNDFIRCIWQIKHFQNEDGSINYDKLKQEYDLARRIGEDDPEYLNHIRELVASAVEECQNNPLPLSNTHGHTAAKVQNCIVENYVKFKKDME